MTEKERLIWYCHLTLHGYTGKEADQIIDKAIRKHGANFKCGNSVSISKQAHYGL